MGEMKKLKTLIEFQVEKAQRYRRTNEPHPNGIACPNCGRWLPGGEACSCCTITYPHYYYYPPINKTEQAFKILRLLVEEKVIKEPTSFKKFCELIEKLAKVI